jgi:hypothetical protein
MMAFTILTPAGIVLFITKHRGWGSLCFVIALLSLLALL